AEREKILTRDVKFLEIRLIENIGKLLRRENVVARGDRRVRRENALFADGFARFVERTFGRMFQKFPSEFERQKRRMAFVQVINRWFDAELSQQPDTADAEYFFLNDSCFGVAT